MKQHQPGGATGPNENCAKPRHHHVRYEGKHYEPEHYLFNYGGPKFDKLLFPTDVLGDLLLVRNALSRNWILVTLRQLRSMATDSQLRWLPVTAGKSIPGYAEIGIG